MQGILQQRTDIRVAVTQAENAGQALEAQQQQFAKLQHQAESDTLQADRLLADAEAKHREAKVFIELADLMGPKGVQVLQESRVWADCFGGFG